MDTEKERMLREDAKAIFQAAVDRVMPQNLFSYCLAVEEGFLRVSDGTTGKTVRAYDLSVYTHIVIAAFGKAALPMATSFVSTLGNRVSSGLVVTKAVETEAVDTKTADAKVGGGAHAPAGGQESLKARQFLAAHSIRVVEASHPVPDERSWSAARGMLALAADVRRWEALGEKTLVCVLVSGGGSALLSAPADGLSLEDKAAVTKLLLGCGATIHELNTVRKHLSAIKGGQLAKAFFPATVLSLVLSDVVGDDLDTIASGPTVADRSTWRDVAAIFERFRLAPLLPENVARAVEEGVEGRRPETPKPGDAVFQSCTTVLVGTNFQALLEAERAAKARGYNTLLLGSRIVGEAREIAKVFSGMAQDLALHGKPVAIPACIIAGGETTVTLRGKGKGGRNQEMALSFLNEFERFPAVLDPYRQDIVFLSAGTDGNDGPTDAAGAFADSEALATAQEQGLNLEQYLAENDSYHFFEAADGLFKTGPTGTNVCDIQILLVGQPKH
ncbi:MAG: glycerate kinase [Rectinema sp.]